VSQHMYLWTLRACLPRMPITLNTTRQLSSFSDILHSHPDVAPLVHHLWVSPLRTEDARSGHAILRACTNVRVLACDARSLVAAIAKPSKFKHTACRDLTLLLSRPRWEQHLGTPSGLAFVRRLTHLRVLGEGMAPRVLGFPALTHLSYVDRPPADPSTVEYPWALGHAEVLPLVQAVVLTRRSGPEMGAPERIGARIVVMYVSRQSTEMQTWCDGVRGRNLWERAGSVPHSRRRAQGSV
jgi:hypothetical protein